MNLEYDRYCRLDKLHIYREGPEKFGGREDVYDTRVARVCGGGAGPKYQRANFVGMWLNIFHFSKIQHFWKIRSFWGKTDFFENSFIF